MTDTRVTTIRMPATVADEAEYVARVDGKPVSEFIREAVIALIAERRKDPEFRTRLQERVKADQSMIQRMTAPVEPLTDKRKTED